MIGKLKGNIDSIYDDHCLLDVNGVCYVIYCPSKMLKNFSIGEITEIFIQTMVKDEIQVLYGFFTQYEKELFLLLTSIQGVGARMGMSIIDDLGCEEIINAIKNENAKFFQNVSGIGSKIAERIVNELKSNKKLFNLHITSMAVSDGSKFINDAISALTNLGFKKFDVMQIVTANAKSCNSLEEIIKIGIVELGKR